MHDGKELKSLFVTGCGASIFTKFLRKDVRIIESLTRDVEVTSLIAQILNDRFNTVVGDSFQFV